MNAGLPNIVQTLMSSIEHGELSEDTVIKLCEMLLAKTLKNDEKEMEEELESTSTMEQSESSEHETVKNSSKKRGMGQRVKRKTMKNNQGEPKETKATSTEDLETGVKKAEEHQPTRTRWKESEVQKDKLTLKAILLKEIPKMQPGK